MDQTLQDVYRLHLDRSLVISRNGQDDVSGETIIIILHEDTPAFVLGSTVVVFGDRLSVNTVVYDCGDQEEPIRFQSILDYLGSHYPSLIPYPVSKGILTAPLGNQAGELRVIAVILKVAFGLWCFKMPPSFVR